MITTSLSEANNQPRSVCLKADIRETQLQSNIFFMISAKQDG